MIYFILGCIAGLVISIIISFIAFVVLSKNQEKIERFIANNPFPSKPNNEKAYIVGLSDEEQSQQDVFDKANSEKKVIKIN